MTNTFSDHKQVEVVSTFAELVNTHFQENKNAICWYRNLVGDFKEIVAKLKLKENITEISTEDLLALELSEQGDLARDIILKDMQLLTDMGHHLYLIYLSIMNVMKSSILFQQMSIHFMLIVPLLKPTHSYVLITALLAILCRMIRLNKKF